MEQAISLANAADRSEISPLTLTLSRKGRGDNCAAVFALVFFSFAACV
jgi:hypothetical protein